MHTIQVKTLFAIYNEQLISFSLQIDCTDPKYEKSVHCKGSGHSFFNDDVNDGYVEDAVQNDPIMVAGIGRVSFLVTFLIIYTILFGIFCFYV